MHPVNKKPTCLTIQHLGEQVSKDLLGRDVGHKGFAHCNGLTNCMVADQVRFLLSVDSYLLTLVMTDMLSANMYEGSFTVTSITRSEELVANAAKILNAMFHGAELSAKH